MEKEIIVIAEVEGGRILPATYELLAFAQRLRPSASRSICLALPGQDIQVALDLAASTGTDVIALEGNHLEPYNGEAWQAALAAWLAEIRPRYVCLAHSSRGADVAPGLAVRLDASCITAIEDVQDRNGVVVFRRRMYNGKVIAEIRPERAISILTIQPGVFTTDRHSVRPCSPSLPTDHESKEASDQPAGSVDQWRSPACLKKTRSLGMIPAEETSWDLALADVVVTAGKGIGVPENLSLIRALAGLFPRSAVGGSRTVCDLGWLPRSSQIGLTGKTVSPKLYIACGVSGAIQHIAGMHASQYTVAINKDPGAAIFQIADMGIVEDLTTFIPLVIENMA
jgi:electron transfer flavoprotein alpha subunit